VGASTAKTLARSYGSLDSFLGAADACAADDGEARAAMAALPDIGAAVVESVAAFFANPHARAIVGRLVSELDVSDTAAGSSPGALSGMTVVFTGTLARLDRGKAKEMAEALGAKVSGSVSSKTSLLVAGPGAGSKMQKARDLGVRVLTEDEWFDLASSS
jgi:DNA ligase (NAD+)